MPDMDFKWVTLFLATLFMRLAKSDLCDGPFSQFLQCMGKDADTRIDNYNKEITPASQTAVKQCFLQVGCAPPDFSQAQVGFFVQEPWTSRINAFLNVMEGMDPRVQRCMLDYFKGITANKINECVKKHGPKDVRDFQMPPIPGGNNIDMTKMKTVFLDRMMVRYSIMNCASIASNPQAQSNIVSCIKAARQDIDDGGMCTSRENCVHSNIKDIKCNDRFNKVQKTACDCFSSEQGHKDMEKEMKNSLLSGAVEKKFKECHEQNGLPYPKDKVDAAKQAAKAGFLEYLQSQGQLPQGVQGALGVGKQVLGEMSEQWKGAFCADCHDVNGDTLRQTAAEVQPQLPQSPLASQFRAPNQFQPAAFPSAAAPVASAPNFGGASQPNFVIPPPLPPQASLSQSQLVQQSPQVFQPQQQTSGMSFEDFKQRLAETFGPVG